jgi:hypothetical protein
LCEHPTDLAYQIWLELLVYQQTGHRVLLKFQFGLFVGQRKHKQLTRTPVATSADNIRQQQCQIIDIVQHQTSMTATLRLHVTTVELGQFGQHRLQLSSARSTIQIGGF